MSSVYSSASGHVRRRNSNEVNLGTLGNGSALLCDAGENETDGMLFAFAKAPSGLSAANEFGVVEATFAASAEAELRGLSSDPWFVNADVTVVEFRVFLGNLKRSVLSIEPIPLRS